MASLKSIELFLEFEPIVKLVCENENCKHNLLNSYNDMDRRMYACNLKQIVIGEDGKCQNFEPVENEN